MDLTIHNALHDKTLEPVHLGIQNGQIKQISSGEIAAGDKSIDARGAMVSPALIEPHFHIENALVWDEGNLNQSGTLREAIDIYADVKIQFDTQDIVQRATQTILDALRHGTLWMRNHVDIDQYAKLDLLNGVVAAREKFKHVFDLQIIAFPSTA